MKRLSVSMNIRIARSIRRASRLALWLSTVLLLISLLPIAEPPLLHWALGEDSTLGWLMPALVVTAALALFMYLGALEISQMLAGREFAAALAGKPETNRPIILALV
jgi:hypothetical protein